MKVLNKQFFLPWGYTEDFPQSHLIVFLKTVSDHSAWKKIKSRYFLCCDTVFHAVTGLLSFSLMVYPGLLITKTIASVYWTVQMGSCFLTHSLILLGMTVRWNYTHAFSQTFVMYFIIWFFFGSRNTDLCNRCSSRVEWSRGKALLVRKVSLSLSYQFQQFMHKL